MTLKGAVRGKGDTEAAIAEAEGASELLATVVPTVPRVLEHSVQDAERAVQELMAEGERAAELMEQRAEPGGLEGSPAMSDELASLVSRETREGERRLEELRAEEGGIAGQIVETLRRIREEGLEGEALLRAGEELLEARRRLSEIYREAEGIFQTALESLEAARAEVRPGDRGDFEGYLAYMRGNAEDIADVAEANARQIAALERLPGEEAHRNGEAARQEQELRGEVEAAMGAVEARLEGGGAVDRSVFEGCPLAGRLGGRQAEERDAFFAGETAEFSGRNVRTARWLQEHEEQLAASGVIIDIERNAQGRATGAYTLVNLRFIPESVSEEDRSMLSGRLQAARESFEAGETDAAQETAAAVSAYLDLQRGISTNGARLAEGERELAANASEAARRALREGDSESALDASSAGLQLIQYSLGTHELGTRVPEEARHAMETHLDAATALMQGGEYERAGTILLALNNYMSAAAQQASSEEAAASARRMRIIISPERCALFFDESGRFSAEAFERRTGVSYDDYRNRGGEERGVGLLIATAHRRAASQFGDAMGRLEAVMDAAEAGEAVGPDALAEAGQLMQRGRGASLQAQQLRQIATGYVRDGRRPTETVTLEGQEEGTIRIQDAITRYGAIPTALALDLTPEGNIVSPVAREEMLPQQEDVERGRRTVILRTGGVFFAVAAADMEAVEREERRRRVASRSATEAAAGLLGGYEMQATFERGILISLGDVHEMGEALDGTAGQARSAGRPEFMGHSRVPEDVSRSVERARDSARQVMEEGEIPSAPTEEAVVGGARGRLDDAAGRYHRDADEAFRRGVALIAATAPSMLDVRDGHIVFRDGGRAREYAGLQDDFRGLLYAGPTGPLFERGEREEAVGHLHEVVDDPEAGDPIEQRVVRGSGVYSPNADTWHENIESSEVADTVLEARRLADERGLNPYDMSGEELGALVEEARGRARSYRSSTVAHAYIEGMEAVAEAPIRLEESLQRYAVRLQERANFEGMRMRETLRNYVIASELLVAGVGLAIIGLPEALGVLAVGGAGALGTTLALGSVLFSGVGIYGSVMSSVDYVRMNNMAWDALERGDYATYRMAHGQMTNILGMQMLNSVVMGAGGGAARLGMRATTAAAERGLEGLAATYLRTWSGAGSLALRGAEGYGLYVMTRHALHSAEQQDEMGDHVGAWTTRIMAIAPLAHMTLAHGAGSLAARAQARRELMLGARALEVEVSLREQAADPDITLDAANLLDRRYGGRGIEDARPVTDEHLAAVDRRIAAGQSEADAIVAVAMERAGRAPRLVAVEGTAPRAQEGGLEITVEPREGVIEEETPVPGRRIPAVEREPISEATGREEQPVQERPPEARAPGEERRLTDPEEAREVVAEINERAESMVAERMATDLYDAWGRAAADIAAERGFNPLDLIPHVSSRQRDVLRTELNYRGQFRQAPPIAREAAAPVEEAPAAAPRAERPSEAAPALRGGGSVAEIEGVIGAEMAPPIEGRLLQLLDLREGPLIMRIARTLWRAHEQGRAGELPPEMRAISEDPIYSDALRRLARADDLNMPLEAVRLAEEIYVRRQLQTISDPEVAAVARGLADFTYGREIPARQTARRGAYEAARDRVMLDARARVRPGDRPVINAETIAWEAETLVRQGVAQGQAEVTVREAAPAMAEMIPERTLAQEIGPAARPETLRIARDLDQMLLFGNEPSMLSPELRARAATPEYRHALQSIETAVAAGADRVAAIAQEARIISIDQFVQARSTPARRAVEHRAGAIVGEAAAGGRVVSAEEARLQAQAEALLDHSPQQLGMDAAAAERARAWTGELRSRRESRARDIAAEAEEQGTPISQAEADGRAGAEFIERGYDIRLLGLEKETASAAMEILGRREAERREEYRSPEADSMRRRARDILNDARRETGVARASHIDDARTLMAEATRADLEYRAADIFAEEAGRGRPITSEEAMARSLAEAMADPERRVEVERALLYRTPEQMGLTPEVQGRAADMLERGDFRPPERRGAEHNPEELLRLADRMDERALELRRRAFEHGVPDARRARIGQEAAALETRAVEMRDAARRVTPVAEEAMPAAPSFEQRVSAEPPDVQTIISELTSIYEGNARIPADRRGTYEGALYDAAIENARAAQSRGEDPRLVLMQYAMQINVEQVAARWHVPSPPVEASTMPLEQAALAEFPVPGFRGEGVTPPVAGEGRTAATRMPAQPREVTPAEVSNEILLRSTRIREDAAAEGRRMDIAESVAQAAAELADSNSGIRLETMGLSDSALTRAREIYRERVGRGETWMASSERLVPPEARRAAVAAEERAAEQPAELAVGDREARGAEGERRGPALRAVEPPAIERQAYESGRRALEDALIDRDIEGAVAVDAERLLSRRHGQEEPRPPAGRTLEPITEEHLSRMDGLIRGGMSEADAIIQVARELNEAGFRGPEPRQAEPLSVDMVRYRSREAELSSRSLDIDIDGRVAITADGLLRTLYGVEPARGRAPEQITREQLRARVDALMREPGREGMTEVEALIEVARSMHEPEPPGRGPGGGPRLRAVEREGPGEAPVREEVPPSREGGPEARAGGEAPVSERREMVERARELRDNPEALAELAFRYATAEEGARPDIIGDLPPLARRAVEQLASDPVFRRISETIARRAGSPERSLQSFRDMYPTRFGSGLRDSAERAAGWMAPRTEAVEAREALAVNDDVVGGLARHGGEQEGPGRLETYAMMGERDIPPAVVEHLVSEYNSGMGTPDVAEMRGLLGERAGGSRPSREQVREAAQTALELRMPQSRDELSPTARSLLDQAMELGQALRSPNERVRAAARANLDAMDPGPMRDALEYMLITGSEFEANRPPTGSHPSDYQLLIAEMLGRRVGEEAGGSAPIGVGPERIAELGQLARNLRGSEGTPSADRWRQAFEQSASGFSPEEAILFGRAYRAAGSSAAPARVGRVEAPTPRVAGPEEHVAPSEARRAAVESETAAEQEAAAVGDRDAVPGRPGRAEPGRVASLAEERQRRAEELFRIDVETELNRGNAQDQPARRMEDARSNELVRIAQTMESRAAVLGEGTPEGEMLLANARRLRGMAAERESTPPARLGMVPEASERVDLEAIDSQLQDVYHRMYEEGYRGGERSGELADTAYRLELQRIESDPALSRELEALRASSSPEEYARALSIRYWNARISQRAAANPTMFATDELAFTMMYRNRARARAEVDFYDGRLRIHGDPVPEAELYRRAPAPIEPVAERPAEEAPRPIGLWDRIRGRRERVDDISERLAGSLDVPQEEFGRLHARVLVGADGRPVVAGFDVMVGTRLHDARIEHPRRIFILDVGGARVPVTTSATGEALTNALSHPRFDRTAGRAAPAQQWEATAGMMEANPQLEVAVTNLPADRVLGERHREGVREAARVLDALSDPEFPIQEVPREYRNAVAQLRRRFQWRPESEQAGRDRAAFIAELAAGLQHLRERAGGAGPYR